MIEFDCPYCGKHYSFSDRFGGRAMFCTECKTPLNVPKPEDIPPRIVVPPPLPPTFSSTPSPIPIKSVPLPPLLSEGMPPIPILPASPMTEDEADDVALVAYALTEKYQERPNIPPQPPLPPAPQTTKPSGEQKTQKKSLFQYWSKIGAFFLFVVGLMLFLFFSIDWRDVDQRLEILEKINERKTQTIFEANNKETESNTLGLRSLEIWNNAGETIDALIVTLGGNITKSEGKETATEQRLNDLRKMIQLAIQQATETEIAQETAVQDAKHYRAESKFFTEQENELREQIQRFPNDRTFVAMPPFDAEREIISTENTFYFNADWTENHYKYFDFSTESTDQFYAVFDGIKRLYGRQSLRISVLEKTPVTIIFPPKKVAAENPFNQIELKHAGCFAFSIRFPEISDPLRIGQSVDTGKIGEFRVRFVYPTGYVDFETVSPRYCEALFYDSCGTYVPVEFPLSGNAFWKRTDHLEDANIDIANEPIHCIEIRLTPLLDQTTFWLDGIALTEKVSREPYDLLQAEARQAEIRKRDSSRSVLPVRLNEKLPETDVTRLSNENLFQWVLQTAKGKIRAKQGNETLSFDSQSQISDTLEGLIVEEIDLTGFHNLTEDRLDELGGLKNIKRLNLNQTGLKNGDLIKLATLTSLESLNLSGNKLSFEGLTAIRTLKELKELNLDDIKSSVNGIDALGTMTSLRLLSMSRSGMDNSDLLYLLPLADLETLDLSATKIGDKGLPIFRIFTGLRVLNLSETRITNAGIVSLASLNNLKVLQLDRTDLNDACLENLAKLKMLESISVRKTGITPDSVRKIFGNAKFDCFKFTD